MRWKILMVFIFILKVLDNFSNVESKKKKNQNH